MPIYIYDIKGLREKNADLGKNLKRERKGENCYKTGLKGLKITSFRAINRQQKIVGGLTI